MTERRTFGPTVLLGLAGSGLAALAGTREWATSSGDAAGLAVTASVTGAEASPLVAALSLVGLAAWGVVLVLRGKARRAVAVVGLAASVGALLAVVLAFGSAQDDAVNAVIEQGASGDVFSTGLTAWYYASAAFALLASLAFVVAILRSPSWPAMGTRYDAPAARRAAPATEEDMWRAIDEGRDPTS
jgi:uncharacterized membrane protein (TIGR02234 family)